MSYIRLKVYFIILIYLIFIGKGSSKMLIDGGKIPLISSTSKDNGIMGYVDGESNMSLDV